MSSGTAATVDTSASSSSASPSPASPVMKENVSSSRDNTKKSYNQLIKEKQASKRAMERAQSGKSMNYNELIKQKKAMQSQ